MGLSVFMELDGFECELNLESMLISEARELKRLTGWDYITWREQLGQSDPDAVAFAWWISNRRAGRPLAGPFSELDFDMVALNVVTKSTPSEDTVADGDEDGDDTEGPTFSGPEPAPST